MTMTSLSAALGERWTPVQVADLIVVLTDNGDNCSLAPSTHLSVTQDSLRPTSGLGLPRGCPPPPQLRELQRGLGRSQVPSQTNHGTLTVLSLLSE